MCIRDRTGADANPNCAVGAPAVHSRNGESSAKKLKEVERRDLAYGSDQCENL